MCLVCYLKYYLCSLKHLVLMENTLICFQALEEIDKEGFLLPIITTYIKQSTPDIGEALKYIRRTKCKTSDICIFPVAASEDVLQG
jgi:hypothetical protein